MNDCLFCNIANGKEEAFTWYETDELIAFLDIHPLFEGHTLLIPKQHIDNFHLMPSSMMNNFFSTAQSLSETIKEKMNAQGTFIAMNNIVSQSVPHLHLHIVPRTKGDGLKGFFWPRKKISSSRLNEIRNILLKE